MQYPRNKPDTGPRPEPTLGLAGDVARAVAARRARRPRPTDLSVLRHPTEDKCRVEFRCLDCEALIIIRVAGSLTYCYQRYHDQICPLCRPAEPATEPRPDGTAQN